MLVRDSKAFIMKKTNTRIAIAGIVLFCFFVLPACFKDNCMHTYKIFTPVYRQLSELRKEVKMMPARPLGNAGKLYLSGNRIYINERSKGVHIIDNTNPSHPVNKSFVNIPGNLDLVLRGDILYSDLYCDLAAIDIGSGTSSVTSRFLTNIFPDRSTNGYATTNPDSIKVIVDWVARDTTVSCETIRYWQACASCGIFFSAAMSSSSVPAGMGGSMARFAAVNNYLYAVSTTELNVVDISSGSQPVLIKKSNIGWNIETIFPFNNTLFIGAGASMSMYDIQDPANPRKIAWTGHWCSGDPVIADGKYAYVTLHEADVCRNKVNQLEIYDIQSQSNPVLVKIYSLTNPQGLSKAGNLLFICDGKDGLKVYDAADVQDLKLIKHIQGLDTYDVIAVNGIAYVVTTGGLCQYDYSDRNNIRFLSKIGWNE
jgi:hypothetical protein